ncbi:MAG: glycosyltransferase family 39 protein [Candidatus Zixiibacteriota bacterium]|jgi:4-amino-4-deoxy-L-arabinose transferase-like glycosyltransferase
MMANVKISRSAEAVLLILILVLALAPRIWCFVHNSLPDADAGNILEVGHNLAEGRGYTTYAKWDFYGERGPVVHPEGNRQPLLPLVAAAAFSAGADSPTPVRVVTVLASLAALFLLYLLAKRWFGPGIALAGAAVAALEPSFLWFSVRVMPEAYFALLFFAALAVAGDFERDRPTLLRPLLVGVLLSLSYLCRLNGVLLLVAYVAALLIVYRGRGLAPAGVSLGAFGVASLPWWIRNISAFGDPFYSRVKLFVVAPSPEQVFAIKRYVPTWSGYFASYGFFDFVGRIGRGLWRGVETLFLGNLHLSEPYRAAPLVAFALLAVVAVPILRRRRALAFPVIALLAHLLAFSVFGFGLFRYFVPFYLLLIPLGFAGLTRLPELFRRGRFWATAALVVFLLIPLVRPFAQTLTQDDRAAYEERREVAAWLAEHTEADDAVVTWPGVINLLYDYDRPSLYWPNGGIREIQAILTDYDVRYVVLEPAALARRPGLRAIWYRGYRNLTKVPMDSQEGELTIVRIDYGAGAFKEAFRPEGSDVVVYEVDQQKLRATVYGAYLTGIQ